MIVFISGVRRQLTRIFQRRHLDEVPVVEGFHCLPQLGQNRQVFNGLLEVLSEEPALHVVVDFLEALLELLHVVDPLVDELHLDNRRGRPLLLLEVLA